jgi:predicted membrane channel-forming protein YqfA (hemolysin III family)
MNVYDSQSKDSANSSWIYIGLAILIGGIILYVLFNPLSHDYVKVKYRDDKVNVSASSFTPLDRSDSTVKGAWYDSSNEYLVIKLNDTYYHYCGMPGSAWRNFSSTSSLYSAYQDDIKGNFDCRVNPVPRY